MARRIICGNASREASNGLGLDQIPLWQLHRIDTARCCATNNSLRLPPCATRVAHRLHVGLSEVGIEDIAVAQKFFPVASVQNQYDPLSRHSEDVLDYCEKHGICFIPWAPLGSGALARSAAFLPAVAERLHATSGQVVLAWLLKRSPVMLLNSRHEGRVDHLVENVAAAELALSEADLAAFDALRKGAR